MGKTAKNLLQICVFALALCCFCKTSVAETAEDELCREVPDCEALGYSKDVVCEQNTALSCPYNSSYKKCVNASCEEMGFSLENKSEWCEETALCPSDENYTLCVKKCGECEGDALRDPDCPYGRVLQGQDSCGHACYVCNTCKFDDTSGYKTAREECLQETEYVRKTIAPMCEENMLAGSRYECELCPVGRYSDRKNAKTCKCNESMGYYSVCPEGAVCDQINTSPFGYCYKTKQGGTKRDESGEADGCIDQDNSGGGYISTQRVSNIQPGDDLEHFEFVNNSGDVPFEFNVDGQNVTCKKVDGCKVGIEGALSPDDVVANNIDTSIFVTKEYKVSNTKCIWFKGCNGTEHHYTAEQCATGRSFTLEQEWGGHLCGKCNCDNAKQYYEEEPTGRSYELPISEANGVRCFHTNGCDAEHHYTQSFDDERFVYAEPDTRFQPDCRQVLGCRDNIKIKFNKITANDVSQIIKPVTINNWQVKEEWRSGTGIENETPQTFFNIVSVSNAGYSCFDISDECVHTKNKEGTCVEGKTLSNARTATKDGTSWSLTCGDCICDEANGYYDTCPQGAQCTTYNGCFKPLDCDGSTNWVNKTGFDGTIFISTSETSFYVSGTNGSVTEVTCKKIVGCNESNKYYATPEDGMLFETEETTSGQTTCYKTTGCKVDSSVPGYKYINGQKSARVSGLTCYVRGGIEPCPTDTYSNPKSDTTKFQCTEAAGVKSGEKNCYTCKCSDNYCGGSCSTKLTTCSTTEWPYTYIPNATMGDFCEGVSKDSKDKCVYANKRYKSFTCNNGFYRPKNNNQYLDECKAKVCSDYSNENITLVAHAVDNDGYIYVPTVRQLGSVSGICYVKKAKTCANYGLIGSKQVTDMNLCTGTSGLKIGETTETCYDCSGRCPADKCMSEGSSTCNVTFENETFKCDTAVANAANQPKLITKKQGGTDQCEQKTVYTGYVCNQGYADTGMCLCRPWTCEDNAKLTGEDNTAYAARILAGQGNIDLTTLQDYTYASCPGECNSREMISGTSTITCYTQATSKESCSAYNAQGSEYFETYAICSGTGNECTAVVRIVQNVQQICWLRGNAKNCKDYNLIPEEEKDTSKVCKEVPQQSNGQTLKCYTCGDCEFNKCTSEGSTTPCNKTVTNINPNAYYPEGMEIPYATLTGQTSYVGRSGTDACVEKTLYSGFTCDRCYKLNDDATGCRPKTCTEINSNFLNKEDKREMFVYELIDSSELKDGTVSCATEDNPMECYRRVVDTDGKAKCNEMSGYYRTCPTGYTCETIVGTDCVKKLGDACNACYKSDGGSSCVAKQCSDWTDNHDGGRTYVTSYGTNVPAYDKNTACYNYYHEIPTDGGTSCSNVVTTECFRRKQLSETSVIMPARCAVIAGNHKNQIGNDKFYGQYEMYDTEEACLSDNPGFTECKQHSTCSDCWVVNKNKYISGSCSSYCYNTSTSKMVAKGTGCSKAMVEEGDKLESHSYTGVTFIYGESDGTTKQKTCYYDAGCNTSGTYKKDGVYYKFFDGVSDCQTWYKTRGYQDCARWNKNSSECYTKDMEKPHTCKTYGKQLSSTTFYVAYNQMNGDYYKYEEKTGIHLGEAPGSKCYEAKQWTCDTKWSYADASCNGKTSCSCPTNGNTFVEYYCRKCNTLTHQYYPLSSTSEHCDKGATNCGSSQTMTCFSYTKDIDGSNGATLSMADRRTRAPLSSSSNWAWTFLSGSGTKPTSLVDPTVEQWYDTEYLCKYNHNSADTSIPLCTSFSYCVGTGGTANGRQYTNLGSGTYWAFSGCKTGYHLRDVDGDGDRECEKNCDWGCNSAMTTEQCQTQDPNSVVDTNTSTYCTPKNENCTNATPIPQKCKCKSGWGVQNGKCQIQCSAGYHQKDTNSDGVYDTCEQDCAVVTSCSGYNLASQPILLTQVVGDDKLATFEKCQKRTKECTYYDKEGWKIVCDTGYHSAKRGSGWYCQKDCNVTNCTAYTGTLPDHASYTTCKAQLTSCVTQIVNVGWKCDAGYEDNGKGGCDECPESYYTTENTAKKSCPPYKSDSYVATYYCGQWSIPTADCPRYCIKRYPAFRCACFRDFDSASWYPQLKSKDCKTGPGYEDPGYNDI